MKTVFIIVLILFHFDFKKQIVIKIDTLNYIVAEIISQYDNNENLRFVAYFSIKMLFVECNYEIYDKKLLIIIRAFELWRFEFEKTE